MSPNLFLPWADLLPEPALLVAGDGTVHAANLAFGKQMGASRDAFSSRPLAELVRDEPGGVRQYLRYCARTRSPVLGSLTLTRGDGEAVVCRCEGALLQPGPAPAESRILLRLRPKEAAGEFHVLTQKIEELGREIHRRRRVELELRKQREWLHVTLSSIGDAVIATDTEGRVTFMNPVAEALTGWPQADGAGQPLERVFRIVNEDTRNPVDNPVVKALRDGTIVGLANHTLLIARDGKETAIDDCAAPIRMEGGAVAGAVLVFHGITERRNLERELGRQNAKLIEADRRKDEFLAMLGHELRNPLAPLSTSLSVLRHVGGANPLLEQSRAIMERQVKHLVRLVDDLLDVARITRGKIDLRRERVELNDLIDRAVEAVEPLVAAQGHDLAVSCPRGKVWLDADPARIQQCLVNLLNNACKYTPPGGQIRLTAQREGGGVALSVRDNGIGMTPDMVATAFELFAQAERSLARSEGGLGIGLTMVKKLVEMHGGRVTARSEGLGKGTEVVLWLPDATEERAAPVVVPGALPAEAPPERRLRVLVVDDNQDAATSLAELLRSYGHEVVAVVHDGHAAVRAISSLGPAVVLLDIGLPGMSGYEIAERVRWENATPRPRLVAVTGYGLDSDKLKAREAGIDHHIVKPVHPERLRELLLLIAEQLS